MARWMIACARTFSLRKIRQRTRAPNTPDCLMGQLGVSRPSLRGARRLARALPSQRPPWKGGGHRK